MKDTLEIGQKILTNPVPYVNTTVLLGLSAGQWDLMLKILVGFASLVWTGIKIYKEIKNKKIINEDETSSSDKD